MNNTNILVQEFDESKVTYDYPSPPILTMENLPTDLQEILNTYPNLLLNNEYENTVNLPFLAGVVDGDFYFSVSVKPNNNLDFVIGTNQKYKYLIKYFCKYLKIGTDGQNKTDLRWVWRITKEEELFRFINFVEPYIFVKYKQLKIFIKLLELRYFKDPFHLIFKALLIDKLRIFNAKSKTKTPNKEYNLLLLNNKFSNNDIQLAKNKFHEFEEKVLNVDRLSNFKLNIAYFAGLVDTDASFQVFLKNLDTCKNLNPNLSSLDLRFTLAQKESEVLKCINKNIIPDVGSLYTNNPCPILVMFNIEDLKIVITLVKPFLVERRTEIKIITDLVNFKNQLITTSELNKKNIWFKIADHIDCLTPFHVRSKRKPRYARDIIEAFYNKLESKKI